MDKKKLYEAAQKLRSMGRNGDTVLAHINPREAALLKSMGGAGTTNPKTGLPEFNDFGWGSFDSWYTPYVAPTYDFTTPSYSAPSFSLPTYTAPETTWQGTVGSNAGAFGGITNTPEYQALKPSDPITAYVNTPVNMGDPYNLISSGPSYSANQDAFGKAIDYLYNDLKYTGDLGATTQPPAPVDTTVGPSQTVDTSFLDDYLSDASTSSGSSAAPSAPEQPSGGLDAVAPTQPDTSSGGLSQADTSDALTGGANVPQDLTQGPMPTWSYTGDDESAQKVVDQVIKDVFKAPEAPSQPGRATNGMTLKELRALQDAGFGSADISDNQTVDQAAAALQLSRMKPGQALGLLSGVVTGNPYAIASSIASIAGENKVAQAIGVASNLVSGNTIGALSGLANLSGQREIANVISMANALRYGNAGAVAQIAANMTGNRDLAATVGVINSLASNDPMRIFTSLVSAQPTLGKLASGELWDSLTGSTIAKNAPSGAISDAYNYATSTGGLSDSSFNDMLSKISSNYGLDFSAIPQFKSPDFSGIDFGSLGLEESAPALPTQTPASQFAMNMAAPFNRRDLSDPFDWSKYFPKSKTPMIINAPNQQPRVESDSSREPKKPDLEQIFGALDPAMKNLLIERGIGPVIGIHAASGGSIMDSMNSVIKSLTPDFGAPSLRGGLSGGARKAPLQLAQLQQMRQSIVPPMARGGLPTKYKEAAPEGHNPEFITGLTGYYANGRGTGQSDDIPAMLHDGDYVMDADTVAAFGDGSSKAGKDALTGFLREVPHRDGAQGKPVPAKIADGEFVLPESFVTALGNGDNKRGAKMLDMMRENLRSHKRSAPTSKIPPKALSPLDYLKKAK